MTGYLTMLPPLHRAALLISFALLLRIHSGCQAFKSYPLLLTPRPSSILQRRTSLPRLPRLFSSTRDGVRVAQNRIHMLREVVGGECDKLRPSISVIEKQDDLVNFLNEDDRLCVIKFYASWCKSCQKFGTKYRKLAFDEGDLIDAKGAIIQPGNVRFAEAEYTANARLCKSLKIRKLPTIHIYRKGSGKLVDMTCKPSQFQLVIDKIHRLLEYPKDISEDIEEKEMLVAKVNATSTSSFDVTMAAGSNLANEIMSRMRQKEEKSETNETEKENKSWFPFAM